MYVACIIFLLDTAGLENETTNKNNQWDGKPGIKDILNAKKIICFKDGVINYVKIFW